MSLKSDSALCLRVARQLAARGGHGAVVDWFCPDDPANTRGAPEGKKFVDLMATCEDGTTLASEHTTIESYEQQLHEGRQLQRLLVPLEAQLSGRLPRDRSYHLSVGIGAVAAEGLDPHRVQASVAAWVESTAPALPAGRPQVAPGHFASAEPPDVEVAVSLSAWPADRPPWGGNLSVLRFGDDPDSMMRHRVARLRRALTEKLPKLLQHGGSRTVLVLEDVDLAMSNMSDVWLALQAASDCLVLCETIVVAESVAVGVPAHSAVIVFAGGEWLGDFNRNRFGLTDDVD